MKTITQESDHPIESFDFGGLGVVWRPAADASQRRFSVVHHPIAPRHRHRREDEFTCVLRGQPGALLGDEVVYAGPGTWVREPRPQWHTIWNAADTPCEIVKVISPRGGEDCFREVAAARGDANRFAGIDRRSEPEMDYAGVPGLCERFGLTFPQM